MKIYIDAMGGDNAPHAIVEGSVDAVNEYGITLTLVGKETIIKEELKKHQYPGEKIDILNADSVIGFDEEPVTAIRSKDDSSIVVALEAMKGQSDAVLISAGSTGALLAGGLLKLGRIRGIKRPALAVPLPKGDQIALLIDGGANADCKAEYLEQFALLGTIYCENVLNMPNPKVGLLNIGTEEEKGSMMAKEAYQLLKETDLNFIGNVESRDVMTTNADIVVTDGFSGNILLKTMEGMASYLIGNIKESLMSSTKGKIGGMLIKNDLRSLKKKLSSEEVGGAPFLGVNGGVIKAHGNSSAYAFKHAIEKAVLFSEADLIEKIKTALKERKEKQNHE